MLRGKPENQFPAIHLERKETMFKKFFNNMKANTLVGIFLIIPIFVTILVFKFLFNLTISWLPKTTFSQFRSEWHTEIILHILTFLAMIVVFYCVGLLTRNIMGKRLYQLSDKLLASIPFVKGIYLSVRQISESLFTQRNTLFKEVVLIEYPRKGLYSLAFVTSLAPPSVARKMSGENANNECVSLFISTTPNPTSGVFILAARSEIIPLKMPVAHALTFIMSAGAVAPGEHGEIAPTLLDKLEAWLAHRNDSNTGTTDVIPETK